MRRALTTVAVLLFVGATVNVAVAWACCLWLEVFRGQFESAYKRVSSSERIRAARFTRAGATYFESERIRGRFGVNPSVVQRDPEDLIPRWTGLRTQGASYEAGAVPSEYRGVDLRGWPMPSLWLELVNEPSGAGTLAVVGGLDTGRLRRVTWSATPTVLSRHGNVFPVALPLRPRWPGFVVNTIAYAAVTAVIVWLLQTVRRRWRMRQGRCPTCGFPVGATTTCSECGSTVRSHQVA